MSGRSLLAKSDCQRIFQCRLIQWQRLTQKSRRSAALAKMTGQITDFGCAGSDHIMQPTKAHWAAISSSAARVRWGRSSDNYCKDKKRVREGVEVRLQVSRFQILLYQYVFRTPLLTTDGELFDFSKKLNIAVANSCRQTQCARYRSVHLRRRSYSRGVRRFGGGISRGPIKEHISVVLKQ